MAILDKEIRKILLGRTKLLDDGRLSTLEEGDYMMPRGIVDGATGVRILGVMRRAKVLESELSDEMLRKTVVKAMQNIGRGIELQAAPEECACLLRYLLSRPAVLCFYYEDELPVVAAYTGRGLTGFISMARAFARFRKELPESVKYADKAAPDHRKEERAQKKREKAEKKQARKEEGARRKGRKNAPDEPENAENETAAEGGASAQEE